MDESLVQRIHAEEGAGGDAEAPRIFEPGAVDNSQQSLGLAAASLDTGNLAEFLQLADEGYQVSFPGGLTLGQARILFASMSGANSV